MTGAVTWQRAREWRDGALVIATLVPGAVMCFVWATVILSSLAGDNVKGEEYASVAIGLALGGLGLALCVAAAFVVARRTRLSRGRGFALAALVTLVWTVGVFALWGSGAVLLLAALPGVWALMVLTGFTIPVAVLGILGIVVVVVVRLVWRRTDDGKTPAGA